MSETESVQPLLLTVQEAAQALRISRSRMYEILRAGDVEAVGLPGGAQGQRVVYSSLVEYVDRLRQKAQGAA
jgi:excisionase family DNA binding protein